MRTTHLVQFAMINKILNKWVKHYNFFNKERMKEHIIMTGDTFRMNNCIPTPMFNREVCYNLLL